MKVKVLKVAFLLTLMLTLIFAITANAKESGTCGDNLTWELDDSGTLTIEGTGEMNTGDYWTNSVPWNDYKSDITNVVIGEDVTTIGWYAFSGCENLYEITIPDRVTIIGGDAFNSCSNLSTVKMGKGVTLIQGGAFKYCNNLYDVYISDLAAWVNIEFQGNYDSYADDSTPMNYARNMYINEELAEDVTIPDSVEAINAYAFYSWDCLNSVTIPDSVKTISTYAFYGCERLENITLGKELTEIAAYAFSNCSGLQAVDIPEDVTKIGEGAFEYCTNLKIVNIPDGVAAIENGTFLGCDSIEKITISDSVKTIGHSVFMHCDNLTEVVVLDGVESIGQGAFSDCKNLKNITIGKNVNEIAGDAFYNCYDLENVYISDLEAWLNIDFGSAYNQYYEKDYFSTPMRYATNMYINNELAENVVVPDTITALDSVEFMNWKCLKSITIPDSVTSIGENVFKYCDNIEEVILGNGFETIDAYAFSGFSKLKEIIIPDSVISIGEYAFRNCESLRTVTMSSNVDSIANNAFYGTNLLVVFYNGEPSDWDDISFGTGNSGITDAKVLFNAEPNREVVVKEETDENGITWQLTSFGKLTVSGNVSIPDGDRTYEAWENYKNHITSVVIENGITGIGASAFYECASMDYVRIPESVSFIGRSAFYGCKALKKIIIPKNVTVLDEWVLADCDSLERVSLPEGMVNVSSDAFYGSNPSDIYYAGMQEQYNKISGLYNIPEDVTIHYGASMPEIIVVTNAKVEKSISNKEYVFKVTIQDAYENARMFAVLCDDNDKALGVKNKELIGTCGSVEIATSNEATKVRIYVWNEKLQPVTYEAELGL